MKHILFRIIIWAIVIMSAGCHIKQDLRNPNYINHEAGITPLHTMPIYIDNSFSVKDKESISVAVQKWNEALNGYFILKIVSTNFNMEMSTLQLAGAGKAYLIIKVDRYNKLIRPMDTPTTVTLGIANRIGGNFIYIVRDRLGEADIMGLTLHELGHILGAHHTEKHLMSPMYSLTEFSCVDKDAVKQVAEYWHLPMIKMSYCLYPDQE